MSLEVVNIVKNMNGGIWSLNVTNVLYHMKTPKMSFTIVNPAKQPSERKFISAQSFLDVREVNILIRRIRSIDQTNPTEVLTSYKGGPDKNLKAADGKPLIVSRVFKAVRNLEKRSIILSSELIEGEQGYAMNKYGQKVPGIVKPKRGCQPFAKNSISLSKDEALFLSDMLERELAAWRVVLGQDFMMHPEKYKFSLQNIVQTQYQNSPRPPVQQPQATQQQASAVPDVNPSYAPMFVDFPPYN